MNFKKLISYYKPYKRDFFTYLIFGAIASSVSSSIPALVRYITNDVVKLERSEAFKQVSFFAVAMVSMFFVMFIFFKYAKYFGKLMGAKIERNMCKDLFNHYQRHSISFFDEKNTGKLSSIMTIDIRNISQFLYKVPEEILDFIIRTSVAFYMFFSRSVVLGFILLLFFITVILFMSTYNLKLQKMIIKSHEKISDLNAMQEESLSGIRTVKSFANEEYELKKFNVFNDIYFENQSLIIKLDSKLDAIIYSFIIGIIPIFTVMSMFFVINENINLSDTLMFLLYADLLIRPLFSVCKVIYSFQDSIAGFKRFINVMSLPPEIVDLPNAKELPKGKKSFEIEFKNISFKYPNSNKNIFENFSLKIGSGEHIALIGHSGSGKTTLCNLIPRFYDVTKGKVLINNTDVKEIKLEDLRKNIGIVQQDVFLFSGTIMENIRYGNLNAIDEEVIKAAKKADAHNLIIGLENGYNTEIGQGGARLSGGQKQRITIARVFLKNPPILIFDEATSNLDNESEKYIQESIKKLAETRTAIIIAHRISTIKNAKRILVIENGEIKQSGTHEELIKESGLYSTYYNLI